MANLPPPVLPRRFRDSGVFEVDRQPPAGGRVRAPRKARRREARVAEAEVIPIPYRDDWKSPAWIAAYVLIVLLVFWMATRK